MPATTRPVETLHVYRSVQTDLQGRIDGAKSTLAAQLHGRVRRLDRSQLRVILKKQFSKRRRSPGIRCDRRSNQQLLAVSLHEAVIDESGPDRNRMLDRCEHCVRYAAQTYLQYRTLRNQGRCVSTNREDRSLIRGLYGFVRGDGSVSLNDQNYVSGNRRAAKVGCVRINFHNDALCVTSRRIRPPYLSAERVAGPAWGTQRQWQHQVGGAPPSFEVSLRHGRAHT